MLVAPDPVARAPHGRRLALLRGHRDWCLFLRILAGRSSDRLGWYDGLVRLWDVSSGEVRLESEGSLGGVLSCAFSSDGALVVSGGGDGVVRLWDAACGEMRTKLKVSGGGLAVRVFCGRHVACIGWFG